ncbi:MAG: bifunctional phosphoglucose/phosphomannose isomerase [Mycobacteriales bacterium]
MKPADAEVRLDDAAAVEAGDPAGMLRAVASSAAQVRQAVTLAAEAGVDRIGRDGRPRAMVVTGMGGSGVSGDVLAAVAGIGCPVPIVTHRGYGLPGWVGPADLVAAVSCSGSTEETLSATDEALRRGCRLLMVGAADSPLSQRAEQAGAPYVVVPGGRQPRASLWALSVPLVVAAAALDLLPAPPAVLEATAARLESVSGRCRPTSDSFPNPAKALAIELAGALPMVWGASPLAGVAAYRFKTQLAENAKYPAMFGVLPEANHNQVVTFDGPYAGGPAEQDFFRDRAAEPELRTRLHLVLLRDPDEHPQTARRAEVSRELARQRGIDVSELVAEGDSPLERMASLVALIDYATVYLALLLGIDPTPVTAISELKARIAQ